MNADVGRGSWRWPVWVAAAAVVIGAATAFVLATGMRPSYDPFGWMVWGHQVLYGVLNTDGAPSWKPLPFLFTLPYAVFGRGQLWLWTITSVAGSFGGAVFAGRIAYRLSVADVSPGRAWAPWVAGAFAGAGVLGIQTWAHLTLIANSDQLNTTLLLAAIDAHLCRRPRLAFAALWLAALGRPEAWPFLGLYGAWGFWRVRGMRALAVAGLVAIPALWFVIPGLTSKSWFISGDLALNQHTVIHGNKIVGVLSRWRSLYELPMQLAAIAGVAIALARRDRATLGLTGAALLWVVVEMAFALHGWSAVPRYLIEPAAVMIVVAGAGVGQLLAGVPALGARGGRALRVALGVLGPVAVVVLLVALVPTARDRAHVWRAGISQARGDGKVIDRLSDAVADAGGRAAVLACGKPVALNQHQSQLAWAMGLNVAEVGYRPAKQIHSGRPIVVFKQERSGWEVRPYNEPPAQVGRCDRQVRVDTARG